MTRSRRIALVAVAMVALLSGVAASAIGGGAATAPARRTLAAARTGPMSLAGSLVANTTGAELGDGVHDADDNALLGLAELQLARESADPTHYARAQAALDRALELDPQHLDALIGQGTLALARHDFAGALAIGERAVSVDDAVARAYGAIADAQIELGRYDDALESVQRMVDLRPDLASFSRVSYLRELHGDLEGAIEAMALAVEAGGPSAENTEYVRVQLGSLYLAGGDPTAAETAFVLALERLPNYVHATAGLARVRVAQGRLSEAITLYRSAVERAPLPDLVVALGEAYEAAGDDAGARDQYALAESLLALQEANGVAVDLELAAFVADHGDPKRAVELARAAYVRTPSIRAADVLAWSLHAAGESAEAARYAEAALRTGWRDARVLFHAGLIARAAGDTALARERLQLALDLNPGFSALFAPVARAALAGLEEGS